MGATWLSRGPGTGRDRARILRRGELGAVREAAPAPPVVLSLCRSSAALPAAPSPEPEPSARVCCGPGVPSEPWGLLLTEPAPGPRTLLLSPCSRASGALTLNGFLGTRSCRTLSVASHGLAPGTAGGARRRSPGRARSRGEGRGADLSPACDAGLGAQAGRLGPLGREVSRWVLDSPSASPAPHLLGRIVRSRGTWDLGKAPRRGLPTDPARRGRAVNGAPADQAERDPRHGS